MNEQQNDVPERIWIDLHDGDEKPLPFVFQRMPVYTRTAERCFEYVRADAVSVAITTARDEQRENDAKICENIADEDAPKSAQARECAVAIRGGKQ